MGAFGNKAFKFCKPIAAKYHGFFASSATNRPPFYRRIVQLLQGGIKPGTTNELADAIVPQIVTSNAKAVNVNALQFSSISTERGNVSTGLKLLDIIDNEYVVIFRAKLTNASGIDMLYLGNNIAPSRFYARREDSAIRIGVYDQQDIFSVSTDFSAMHEFAIENTGTGNANLYIDGVLEATLTNITTSPVAGYDNILIGGDGSYPERDINGCISDYRIYKTGSLASTSDDNLVYRLPMQEGSGNPLPTKYKAFDSAALDSCWSLWIHPLAVNYNGYLYWGTVSRNPTSQRVHRRNNDTGFVETKIICTQFGVDDHSAPAVYVDDNGIAIFAAGHDTSDTIYWDRFDTWADVTTLASTYVPAGLTTYNQVFRAGDRYYHAARSSTYEWYIRYSDDVMSTWSTPEKMALKDDMPRVYQLFREIDSSETIIGLYPHATAQGGKVRFGKVIGNTLHVSGSQQETFGSLPSIDFDDYDLVYDTDPADYTRFLDVNKWGDDYYVLFIVHDYAGTGTYYTAKGDFGSWEITNTGLDAGSAQPVNPSNFGLGAWDTTKSTPHFYASILDDGGTADIISSAINLYEADGTFVSELTSGTNIKMRPYPPKNGEDGDVLWCNYSEYTGFSVWNGNADYIETSHLAIEATIQGDSPPTWGREDVPSVNLTEGFYVATQETAPYIAALAGSSIAANGEEITNVGVTSTGAMHNGAECDVVQTDTNLLAYAAWSDTGTNFAERSYSYMTNYHANSNGFGGVYFRKSGDSISWATTYDTNFIAGAGSKTNLLNASYGRE